MRSSIHGCAMSVQSPSVAVAVERLPAATAARPPSPWRRLGASFFLAAGWLALVLLAALFGPLLHLADPNFVDLINRSAGFSPAHPLGTDNLGRDVLSRLVVGSRVTLTVGFLSTLLAMLVGGLLGLVAGYYRGRLEALIVATMDALLAFPALVLALAVTAFLGHDLKVIVGVIGFLGIPAFARVTRATTLTLTQREFVLAARALGAGDARILGLEIVPNVLAPVLTFGLLAVAVAMLAEGVLAFLGLSLPPPAASWGAMIAEARASLDTDPQLSLIPSAVFFLTIFALNLAADRLRRIVDVRESRI